MGASRNLTKRAPLDVRVVISDFCPTTVIWVSIMLGEEHQHDGRGTEIKCVTHAFSELISSLDARPDLGLPNSTDALMAPLLV